MRAKFAIAAAAAVELLAYVHVRQDPAQCVDGAGRVDTLGTVFFLLALLAALTSFGTAVVFRLNGSAWRLGPWTGTWVGIGGVVVLLYTLANGWLAFGLI